jgi:deoxyribodipyrimidine photolyase
MEQMASLANGRMARKIPWQAYKRGAIKPDMKWTVPTQPAKLRNEDGAPYQSYSQFKAAWRLRFSAD